MKNEIFAAIAIGLPMTAAAEGSPWLPIPDSTQVSLRLVAQSGDEFYLGRDKTRLPAKIKQDTYGLAVRHGLADQLAIDASLAYARGRFSPPADFPVPHRSESARGDSTLGLSWRVLDEFERPGMPTLTLRIGGIIAGKYETGKIDAVGDGASGFELSLLAGKYMTPALTLAGEVGYRNRNHGVPNDLFGSVNLGYEIASFASISAGYTTTRSRGDLDIGGPGFTPARFPQVREDRALWKTGLALAVAPRATLSLNYGRVVSGRNTIKADVWGVTLGTSF